MKKLMLSLAVALMATIAGNAAGKTVELDLSSVSIIDYECGFSPTFSGATTLTVIKEAGDEMEVELAVPMQQDDVVNVKNVNYLEASLSFWDKDENSVKLDPLPFDMSQVPELVKFLGTKADENNNVKMFKFKGTISKADWKAYNAAESHFLNVINVSITKRK